MPDPLNDLRGETGTVVPPFDEALHVRTMSGVHAARRDRAAARAPESRVRPIWAWGLAMGLTGAIGVTLAVVTATSEAPVQFSPVIASLRDSAAPIAQRVAGPFGRATQELSLIREDAQQFGLFVRDSLDFLPDNTADQKPPS